MQILRSNSVPKLWVLHLKSSRSATNGLTVLHLHAKMVEICNRMTAKDERVKCFLFDVYKLEQHYIFSHHLMIIIFKIKFLFLHAFVFYAMPLVSVLCANIRMNYTYVPLQAPHQDLCISNIIGLFLRQLNSERCLNIILQHWSVHICITNVKTV